MEVAEIHDTEIIVDVKNNFKLGEKKNMNLPGCIVDLPTLTEKDEDDLVEFGLKYNVDFIAASFVRKATDVETEMEKWLWRYRSGGEFAKV